MSRDTAIAATGFGTTVAMWVAGYVGRLPLVMLPSPWLLTLLLVMPFAGGWILGRRTGRGATAGAAAGAISGTLNLLVLGSLLAREGSDGLAPAAALAWLPGSILLSAGLAAVGSALGAATAPPDRPGIGCGAFARVTVVATLLLLGVGGLVTSTGAGLAVVDWPNSFGYNMFLYPLSRMSGGIYYEHAHRLFGALVGLTTLAMALLLQRYDPRPAVRRLAWLAFGMVAFQGLLGGLRVTGTLTLSTDASVMEPNLLLAMVHGVFAQICFATLVALAAFTSREWIEADPVRVPTESGRAERRLAGMLLAAMIGQLLLGAAQRHYSLLLFAHILMGVAVVAPLAFHTGFRAWGAHERGRLGRLGLALVGAASAQVLLGFVAYVTREGVAGPGSALAISMRTAHQAFGAVLLGLVVLHACWTFRLVAPAGGTARKEALDRERSGAPRRVY